MNQRALKDFVAQARKQLAPVLQKHGRILYNPSSTLRPGKYYFMGLNPGGNGGCPIAEDLKKLADGVALESAFEEEWGTGTRSFKQGQHPFQLGAKSLFSTLGKSPSEVLATNLVFLQKPAEADLTFPTDAEICWPVHELMLELVQPKVIFTVGKRATEFVARRQECNWIAKKHSGRGNWACKIGKCRDGRTVVSLPHLSWYAMSHKPMVLNWIAREVKDL